ncbi:hypothetical protein Ddc_22476 [Ditylenchus destructor]|nr:hypothetical protein Ddc_22476 [Ditylenchus destructor]
MSCSKPLQPFVCDSLYYLNRDQLELFSIICRPLKNFIDRYFHSKPYRVFDQLKIREGSYALFHNGVRWHPNRDDYSVQQFLELNKCFPDRAIWQPDRYRGQLVRNAASTSPASFWYGEFFSFAEMRPYLSPTVRIKDTTIYVDGEDFIYSPEHIEEMESLAYLWSNHKICILKKGGSDSQIDAKDFQPILNSPTILQCQELSMTSPYISFKDYTVLYTVKVFEIYYNNDDKIKVTKYLAEFLEQPGLKPIVALHISGNKMIDNLLDRLSKDFSSAISPNSFKIVIHFNPFTEFDPLKEFRETNNTSSEKLELKKGLPTGYQTENLEQDVYTLERSMI